MTFAPEKVETIHDNNHHSVKQNRIRTQNEICFDMWAGIHGSVVTLPGQAISRMSHLYYGITDGFYHPIYFCEMDYGTFIKMKDNHIDYMEYCDHFIDFSEVRTINDNVAEAPPAVVEDLDFCCAPSTIGRIVLARLDAQMEHYVGPRGFSYTIYEVGRSQSDAVQLMNNVIRRLDGATLLDPMAVEMSGLVNQQHAVILDRNYNRSSKDGSYCYKYQPPISINHKGRIEDARWFRFRDRKGYTSSTFAVRYV